MRYEWRVGERSVVVGGYPTYTLPGKVKKKVNFVLIEVKDEEEKSRRGKLHVR